MIFGGVTMKVMAEENERLEAQVEAQKKQIDSLKVSLETAITGLKWWTDECPGLASENDYENIIEFKKVLKEAKSKKV